MSENNEPPEREEGLTKQAARDVRTVAKGGAVQVLGQISQRSFSFFFVAIVLRTAGTVAYGIYRQVFQILSIASQLGLAGYNYAAMRWIARDRAAGRPGGVRGSARVALRGSLIASALVVAVLVVGADLFAQLGDTAEQRAQMASLIRLGALYVPLFAMMQVLRYCTQGYKTMVPSVIAGNIVQPAARFVLGGAALFFGVVLLDQTRSELIVGMIVTLLVSLALGVAVAAIWFRRMLTPEERAAPPQADAREMTRFALPQMGASMLGIQTLGLGVLLLGIYGSSEEVGLFALSISLQGPGTVFLGGIVNIWAPVVSDLHSRGMIERLGSLYQTINRWIATFSWPVWAALIIMPDWAVQIYGGSQAADAAPVVALLAVGNIFYTSTGPTGYVISMTGHPTVNFVNSLASVIVYAVLGAIFVPRYGVVGMAAIHALVTAGVNTARVVQAYMLIGVQPFGRTFYKPVAATLAGAVVLLGWRLTLGSEFVAGLIGIVIAAAVYLVVLYKLGIDPEERMVLDTIRQRAFRGRFRSGKPRED
jgi:O-antigen/teichoic acid export membrane protein